MNLQNMKIGQSFAAGFAGFTEEDAAESHAEKEIKPLLRNLLARLTRYTGDRKLAKTKLENIVGRLLEELG